MLPEGFIFVVAVCLSSINAQFPSRLAEPLNEVQIKPMLCKFPCIHFLFEWSNT